jgi:hypothetical protein
MFKDIVISVMTTTMLLSLPSPVDARTLRLKGNAADAFIEKHFPNASIPGHVGGSFKGYARCFVPAMGGRSNGQVSSCTVSF